MFYEVIPIRVFHENGSTLTYSSSLSLKPGHIVEIPLGRAKTYAIVVRKVSKVNFATKDITRLLYDTPLPQHIVKAIFWLSEYYLTPLPLVAKLFLPQGIGKNRRKTAVKSTSTSDIRTDPAPIPLNSAQETALKKLQEISTPTKLLFGITGSGKTNIYLKLAKDAFSAGKSTILLVPEIALTSQLVQIFEKTFKRHIILIHSRQTEAERHLIWESILNSAEPQIVIGPRSALLSPVRKLGLIIIDEAHESTYFQENAPKYSALRLGSFIASAEKISCIYGTATPLATDYYIAKAKHALVTLSEKAKKTAIAPTIKVINFRNSENFTRNRYFSNSLLDAIARNLEHHEQSLIFHNRRGSAPLTICESCGWQALCPNCYLPLTLHSDSFNLICHTCGYTVKVPTSCPDCGNASILHKGFGTKLLETELKKLFRGARIIRFDADNSKEDSLDANFDAVKTGEFDIIIGTQTIAKGLDLPKLATVGVVQADSGLSLPDFSSEEKTFHLLTQVIGRVGRGHLDTAEVFIQTYQPDHPVIRAGIKNDYQKFLEYTLSRRKIGHFPPYYNIARLTITYKTEAVTIKHIKSYYKMLSRHQNILVSKPTPAFHEHTSNGYTWQIVLRSTTRSSLLNVISSLPPSPNLHFTIDPPSLL